MGVDRLSARRHRRCGRPARQDPDATSDRGRSPPAFAYARNQHGLRDKRPLPRFVARNLSFLAAGRQRRHVQAEMAGLQVLLPTSDRTIARSVTRAATGTLSWRIAFDALERFGHEHEGTVLLEIGANFGVYSLPAVSQFGFARAVAYEPDPGSFALLEHNIERNRAG